MKKCLVFLVHFALHFFFAFFSLVNKMSRLVSNLFPPPGFCLSLVSGLVSQFIVGVLNAVLGVSTPGLVFLLSQVLSPILFSSCSGMRCLWSGFVSRILCAVSATVWGLR